MNAVAISVGSWLLVGTVGVELVVRAGRLVVGRLVEGRLVVGRLVVGRLVVGRLMVGRLVVGRLGFWVVRGKLGRSVTVGGVTTKLSHFPEIIYKNFNILGEA